MLSSTSPLRVSRAALALSAALASLGPVVARAQNMVTWDFSDAYSTQMLQQATWSNTTNSLTFGSVAGLQVGMVVSGTGIPSNSTITAIDGATRVVTISATTTAAGSNATVTAGYRGTSTNGSAVLNISNPTGIVVGMSATGTGIPTGATVTAVDTVAGTVTLSANATSGATNNFTFGLNRSFNAGTNWVGDAAPAPGDNIVINSSTTGFGSTSLNFLVDNNTSIGSITAGFNSLATSQVFRFTGTSSSGDRIVTLGAASIINLTSSSSGNQLVFDRSGAVTGQGAAILAGTNGFTLNSYNTNGTPATFGLMNINSASTISGDVFINSGTLRIGDGTSGSLFNVENYVLRSGASVLQSVGGSSSNVFSDTAVIRLNGGEFAVNSSGNGVSINETVGRIILEGSGKVSTNPRSSAFGQNSTAQSTLNVANGFSRGDNGKGMLLLINGTSTGGGLATDTGLLITNHGFASGQSVIPYVVVQGRARAVDATNNLGDTGGSGTVRFGATNSSGVLMAAVTTAANADLSSWSGLYTASSNINVDSSTSVLTNALTGATSVRTIGIGASGSSSLTSSLALGGNTLATEAIAIVSASGGITIDLGTNNTSRGAITSTGNSGGDVYLFHQRSSYNQLGQVNLNAVVQDNGGAVNLVFAGPLANFVVNSASTHTGKTYIGAGANVSGTTTSYGVLINSGSAGFASSSEINIASGALLRHTAANYTVGGTVSQLLTGGGTIAGLSNVYSATRNFIIGANGTLAPGDAGANENFVFEFTTGKLDFAAGSKVAMDFGSVGNSDKISFRGTAGDWLSGSGNAILEVTTGTGFAYDTAYTVLSNVSTNSFVFNSVKLNGQTLVAGVDYTWSDIGTDYTISFAIPEPASFAGLAGIGVLGFVATRRRRAAA